MLRFMTVLLLAGIAAAGKGGRKGGVDPSILNPAPESKAKNQAAMFNKELFEGDIVMEKGENADRNAVSDRRLRWPRDGKFVFVPFITSGLSRKMDGLIKDAIADYTTYTCIRFVPKQDYDHNYVKVKSDEDGCFAWLGMVGGQQPLNLQDNGCDDKGTVIHEMLHTLGFGHEQSRNDRDQYITVNYHNIESDAKSQFDKMPNENNQGFPYDYNSVMHYPDWGFSKNGKPVIVTKNPSFQTKIGQRSGFSTMDVAEVNKLYNCCADYECKA